VSLFPGCMPCGIVTLTAFPVGKLTVIVFPGLQPLGMVMETVFCCCCVCGI
jgi:hypothetical protein